MPVRKANLMNEFSERAAEVRRAVLSLSTVSDAALLHDERGREVVVSDGFVAGPQVRAALSAAGLRPPDRVVVVPSSVPSSLDGPHTPEQLATWLATPSAQVYEFAAPAGPMEEELCAIWSEVLEVAEVGALDDLLDLGGDSLTGIEIATRIEERYGIECDLELVFRAGTVRALAVELERSAIS